MENTEVTVLTVDEVISSELVKANVTDTLIASLKERFMPLKIAGIEDKETYQLVKEGRKECKKWRIAAEKICKDGREEANKVQKAWVSKEKEVTGKISEVEDYLEKQEKEYEAAVAKDKLERQRKQDEQLIVRQQVLTGMGVLYSEGNFSLGEVSFEMSLVKESEQDIWEETILPKFKEEYEKVEAERIEQERIKKEKEAELKRQEEEMQRKQKELEEREAALKKAEEKRVKREQEEQQRKITEENQRIEKLWRGRLDQLTPIQWNGQEAVAKYDDSVVVATYSQLTSMSDEDFDEVLKSHKANVKMDAEEKERKRLAEIEAQKEIERKRVVFEGRRKMLDSYGCTHLSNELLESYTDDEYEGALSAAKEHYDLIQKQKWEAEQEEKRKAEELKKQQEMEQAKDKEKWNDLMYQINQITVHDMRSSQYRTKAAKVRELLEQIKSL